MEAGIRASATEQIERSISIYLRNREALSVPLLISLFATLALADETSFQRVKVPDPKGRAVKAVLTFSDNDKAIEIQPIKGSSVSIPYSEIDKFSYEFTKKHRVSEGTVATAPSESVRQPC